MKPIDPVPGLYKGKTMIGRTEKSMPITAPVAIYFKYGAPPDPENPDEELDRSHRMMCWVNGVEADPDTVWAYCDGVQISLEEYEEIYALNHQPLKEPGVIAKYKRTSGQQ